MRIIILTLALTIALTGCSESEKTFKDVQKERIDSLKNFVENGHDKIMPDINNILQKRTKLFELRNAILDSIPEGNELTERMRANIADLNKAEAMMFDWMNNYANTYNDSLPDSDRVKILEMNAREIEKMTTLFEDSQKEAELILAQYK